MLHRDALAAQAALAKIDIRSQSRQIHLEGAQYMDSNQITNIAIRIGELGTKTSFALIVAFISAVAALASAIIAGIFAWKLNVANKQHEKQ